MSLFTRHATLFKHAVGRPDSLRRLFQWLTGELGLVPGAALKLVHRCPAVLQADLDGVLRPRLAFLLGLGLTRVGEGGWVGGG